MIELRNMNQYFTYKIILVCLILIILPNSQTYHISSIVDTNQNLEANSTVTILSDLLGQTELWRRDATGELITGIDFQGTALVDDLNGNHYFAGIIEIDLFFAKAFFVGKANSTGTINWINSWQHYGITTANDMTISSEKDCLYVVGESVINSSYIDSDLFISCINYTSGLELWNTTYGQFSLSEIGKSITTDNERLYVVSEVKTDYNNNDDRKILLCCFNATTGNLIWDNVYSTTYSEYNPTISYFQLNNRLYLTYNRYREELSTHSYQFVVHELFSNGTQSWSYNSSQTNLITNINDFTIDSSDNKLLLVGSKLEQQSNYYDAYLCEMSLTGEYISELIWGTKDHNEFATSISEVYNSEFYVGGYGDTFSTKKTSAFISYLVDLNVEWSRKSYEFEYSKILDIKYTTQEEIITVGTCAFQYDFLLTRFLFGLSKDQDHDSLSSIWEEYVGLNPDDEDTDGDGYSDYEEYYGSSDPSNPKNTPKTMSFWRNFGLSIGIIVILSVAIFQFFYQFKPKQNKSLVVKIFDKLRSKIRKNRES